jgi:glycerol-3-phosphate dehydrogenase subunit B
MQNNAPTTTCDLLVIGTGMAGMAAALFAVSKGLDTVQVGVTGEINFASGLFDLLGVHPVAQQNLVKNPWQALGQLIQDEPSHPYARVGPETIRTAMDQFLAFWQKTSYPYQAGKNANVMVVTPVGTLKPTYAVPHTMYYGTVALSRRQSCLFVDFPGLKGYSARQIVLGLAPCWPDLHTARIVFPGLEGELYTERVARALEVPETRARLAELIKPHLAQAEAVGLPAILGIHRTIDILADLQGRLGLPVFEVPTMLPAVTGLRLRETFEQHLPALGVRAYYQQRALHAERLPNGDLLLGVGPEEVEHYVQAKTVILASGRFFGKGLHAERSGIRETIFNLPVRQPLQRDTWHHKDLLYKAGHRLNRAGLETDRTFRPVDDQGRVCIDNLFAVGSILAHQDWVRQKCGSGLAVATAYAAVDACKIYLDALA